MEAVKKYWLLGIFISILTVFAMSYNANAVELVIDLNQYSLKRYIGVSTLNCSFNGGINNQYQNVNQCATTINNTQFPSITSIETTSNYSVKAGDLISFYLIVSSNTNGIEYKPKLNLLNGGISRFAILNYKEVSADDFYKDTQSHNGYINSQGNNYDLNIDFYNFTGFYKIYNVVLRASQNGDFPLGLNAAGTVGLFQFSNQDLGQTFNFRILSISQYEFSGSESNKEQEQKTQAAADASETAGGSSSSDAQTGTTSLINAITGAVTVISSASPTNCRINGNMGNLDMGQLDLCANPAPAFVTTIGSLILILMCVPLAITLFNRFISLFRSFQS